jgi:hypothetical protein
MKQILMIKECKITGLKYLCKCVETTNPYVYHGSGRRWVNHLKKYHENWTRSPNVVTTVLGVYENKEELKKAGIYYSDLFNVVNDPNWANLIPEKGDGGWINDQTGKTWKVKDTSKMKNKKTITKAVKAGRNSIKGTKNHQFNGWYVTPYGTFESLYSAVKKANDLKKQGINEVILSESVLKKYCRFEIDKKLNNEGRRIPQSWRGKTPREIGFDFIEKENK